MFSIRTCIVALAVLAAASCGAAADSVEDFYRGKTVTLAIGFGAGGGYDAYARLLARHMGKHIPGNPTIRPENMPGAGSLKVANWLQETAPRDGTAFGTVASSAPFDPLYGNPAAIFKADQLGYIGSANSETSVCAISAKAGIKTAEDLLAKPIVVGGSGDTSDTVQLPKLLNALLGSNMRIVKGYAGSTEINLAMERGEVDGRCGWQWSGLKAQNRAALDAGEFHVVLQFATARHPDMPNIPSVLDVTTKPEDKKLWHVYLGTNIMGRPYIAPPGLPAERLAALRRAFDATMRDPEFLAEAAKARLEINPVPGTEMEARVAEAYRTDPSIVARLKEILH